MALQPLILEPIFKEKVWGGRRLESFGKTLPDGVSIGESWEVADLNATSASGGGGGSAMSRVAGGEHAGKTLRACLGSTFPLLVKYLDAREHLSVQSHPSPAHAAANPGANLKTECWYVLAAEPGSVIYKGVKPGVGIDELRAAAESGEVESALNAVPAVVGEMHDVPSGTVHALGAGVLVAEIQTPSDTTYRLFDWNELYGRPQREMHLDEGLEAAIFDEPPAPTRAGDGPGMHELVANDFYRVSLLRGSVDHDGSSATIVMAIDGPVTACGAELAHGTTAVLPAGCAGSIEAERTALIAAAV